MVITTWALVPDASLGKRFEAHFQELGEATRSPHPLIRKLEPLLDLNP